MKYIIIFVTGVVVGIAALLGGVWLSEEHVKGHW